MIGESRIEHRSRFNSPISGPYEITDNLVSSYDRLYRGVTDVVDAVQGCECKRMGDIRKAPLRFIVPLPSPSRSGGRGENGSISCWRRSGTRHGYGGLDHDRIRERNHHVST